ncbi:MAG: DUF5519 family protein [Actinomycetota bacterium]|nr:DUF5519 family protein [Actinomycetota bacterium]
MDTPAQRITKEVGSWQGVTSYPHRFGGVEFRCGRVELGHIHGDSFADLPFPKTTHDALLSDGRAEPHHVLPASGWVTKRIRNEADVDEVIELFRLNFERVSTRRARPPASSE